MAGIAAGSEWIAVEKLQEILGQIPKDAVLMASPLGNLIMYDAAGPIEGKHIGYIDLLTETINYDVEPVPSTT